MTQWYSTFLKETTDCHKTPEATSSDCKVGELGENQEHPKAAAYWLSLHAEYKESMLCFNIATIKRAPEFIPIHAQLRGIEAGCRRCVMFQTVQNPQLGYKAGGHRSGSLKGPKLYWGAWATHWFTHKSDTTLKSCPRGYRFPRRKMDRPNLDLGSVQVMRCTDS